MLAELAAAEIAKIAFEAVIGKLTEILPKKSKP